MEFRIKEHDGKFIVEKKFTEIVGFLWWKKEKITWEELTNYGDRLVTTLVTRVGVYTNRQYQLQPFKTLEAAKQQIKIFNKISEPPIYHEIR